MLDSLPRRLHSHHPRCVDLALFGRFVSHKGVLHRLKVLVGLTDSMLLHHKGLFVLSNNSLYLAAWDFRLVVDLDNGSSSDLDILAGLDVLPR